MRYLVPSVLLLTLFLPSLATADDKVEAWDRMHVAGAHAGWVHTVMVTREVDGQKRFETRSESDIALNRLGTTTQVSQSSDTWENAEGNLLRIATRMKMSAQETASVLTFSDGKVAIETTVMGNTRKVEKEAAGDLKGPAWIDRETRKLAGTKDQVLTFESYMAEYQKVIRSTLTSKGLETVTMHDGTKVELTRIDAVIEGVPIKPTSWLNAEGSITKTSLNMIGILFEQYRVATEAEAKAKGEETTGPAPDLFEKSFIREPDPIPVPRQLDEALIEIRKRTPDAEFPDVADGGHAIKTRDDGVLEVHAKKYVPEPGKTGTRPIKDPPAELADALAASSMIQSDAEEMRKVVEEVVGDEADAWKAAQQLEAWVYEYLTKKGFGVAFGSALETYKTREGDCTEHAVLLAALCRAAGIPARVVMGLTYLFGVWGGHAWNDVYIEGDWYPLDATNGYGFVDPLHLPMARMSMKEGGSSEFTQLLGALGKIDVDVTSVVRDGKRIETRDGKKLVTQSEDGTYVNPIWGIAFKAPGFEFKEPATRAGLRVGLTRLEGKTADGKSMTIRVAVMDAPAGGGWEGLFRQLRVDPSKLEEGTVDGRPSRSQIEKRNGRSQARVGVLADGALYIFSLTPADESQLAAFLAFMETVDFDVPAK